MPRDAGRGDCLCGEYRPQLPSVLSHHMPRAGQTTHPPCRAAGPSSPGPRPRESGLRSQGLRLSLQAVSAGKRLAKRPGEVRSSRPVLPAPPACGSFEFVGRNGCSLDPSRGGGTRCPRREGDGMVRTERDRRGADRHSLGRRAVEQEGDAPSGQPQGIQPPEHPAAREDERQALVRSRCTRGDTHGKIYFTGGSICYAFLVAAVGPHRPAVRQRPAHHARAAARGVGAAAGVCRVRPSGFGPARHGAHRPRDPGQRRARADPGHRVRLLRMAQRGVRVQRRRGRRRAGHLRRDAGRERHHGELPPHRRARVHPRTARVARVGAASGARAGRRRVRRGRVQRRGVELRGPRRRPQGHQHDPARLRLRPVPRRQGHAGALRARPHHDRAARSLEHRRGRRAWPCWDRSTSTTRSS